MESSEDLKKAEIDAQRSACFHLRQLVGNEHGLAWDALGKAMFQAGMAYAYFKGRDVCEVLEDKLRQRSKREKKSAQAA